MTGYPIEPGMGWERGEVRLSVGNTTLLTASSVQFRVLASFVVTQWNKGATRPC